MGIYIWGTGCGAADLIDRGLPLALITAFVDNHPRHSSFLGKPVLHPSQLELPRCELLLVATRHTEAVAAQCEDLGLPQNRILYLRDSFRLLDRNAGCTVAAAILGQPLLDRLLPRQIPVPLPPQLRESKLPSGKLQGDFVRLATLELLCRRVQAVPGSLAELGVYRGFFAGCMNTLLPDRMLHLFDSFQGFAPDAGASQPLQEAHAATDAQTVLGALPHPEQARIYPGFFPESLNGLEERFCLVSLDADLYQVTLDGLRYFWPRLNPGGYLLLHDWGNPGLPGVSAALSAYEAELGIPLPGVPLCDRNGTLVLTAR